jgi:hypothetical protein
MKNINTSFVVDPSIQQPLTVKSLDFLQSGNKQMIEALCIHLIRRRGYTYSTSVPYKLVDNAPTYSYIFFNGELYYFNEAAVAFANVAVINTSPDATADPLQFSDGVNRNVHDNRVLQRSTNALGTGVFDLIDIVDISTPDISAPVTVSAFGSGWSAATTVKYRKYNPSNATTGGLLLLEGSAQKSTDPTGSIFTLPVNFRPTNVVYVPVSVEADGIVGIDSLLIDTAGDCFLADPTPATLTTVYLNGISILL